MEKKIENYLNCHITELSKLKVNEIKEGIELITKAISNSMSIYICGNGGSAHIAAHYVTDWSKMYYQYKKERVNIFSLSDNIGVVTAYGNDISFKEIFSQQVESNMKKDDLLICISGSGNSENVINAAKAARKLNANILGVIGYGGGALKNFCTKSVISHSMDMQLCEDISHIFGHLVMKEICDLDTCE